MNDNEIITAIAELDGWELKLCRGTEGENFGEPWEKELWVRGNQRKETLQLTYLTSRDAIVPVIVKVFNNDSNIVANWKEFENFIFNLRQKGIHSLWVYLTISPRQLCEALLQATGKWKD